MMNRSSPTGVYHGTNRLIIGIVLAVITFWLFAQTTLNIAPAMRANLKISESLNNIAVSITSLFSRHLHRGCRPSRRTGLDGYGSADEDLRLVSSALCSSRCHLSMPGLFTWRAEYIQGLSAACVMPATLALMKAYFAGKDRQRALSFWSIGSWGGSGVCSFSADWLRLPSGGAGSSGCPLQSPC